MTSAGSEPVGDNIRYILRLYVTGSTRRSAEAIKATRDLCDTYLDGRHDLEVIDLYQHPEAAARYQIIASPTLVRLLPGPLRRIIGALSDRERTLRSLGIVAQTASLR